MESNQIFLWSFAIDDQSIAFALELFIFFFFFFRLKFIVPFRFCWGDWRIGSGDSTRFKALRGAFQRYQYSIPSLFIHNLFIFFFFLFSISTRSNTYSIIFNLLSFSFVSSPVTLSQNASSLANSIKISDNIAEFPDLETVREKEKQLDNLKRRTAKAKCKLMDLT